MKVYRCPWCRLTFSKQNPDCPMCGQQATPTGNAQPKPKPQRVGPSEDYVRRVSGCCG